MGIWRANSAVRFITDNLINAGAMSTSARWQGRRSVGVRKLSWLSHPHPRLVTASRSVPGEMLAQLFKRFGSMAHSILYVLTEFGEGTLVAQRNKKRIVTESAAPAWGESHPAFARA